MVALHVLCSYCQNIMTPIVNRQVFSCRCGSETSLATLERRFPRCNCGGSLEYVYGQWWKCRTCGRWYKRGK